MGAGNSLPVVVDIHSEHITLEELQTELKDHPSRLEEKENWGLTPLIVSKIWKHGCG